MKHVTLYTDGACRGNPGPGGWGVLLQLGSHEKTFKGAVLETTNNRMELTAVIEGLSKLQRPCRVTVYSDATYVVDPFEKGWFERWKRNGWKTSGKKPVKNRDLWEELDRLMGIHKVEFVKVKGHANDERNICVDRLANEAIDELLIEQGMK